MRGLHLVAAALSLLGIGAGCTQQEKAPSSRPITAVNRDAVFVVNGGDSSISVLDAKTLEPLGTIELVDAVYPHHINLSPDRTKLVVAIPGMDLSSGHGGGHSGHGGDPESALMVLDARTGETLVSKRMGAPSHNGIYSLDSNEIWTSQMAQPGEVLVLDGRTLETRKRVAVGDMPAEVTLNPDGVRAFVANGASGTVSVIDTETKEVLRTVAVGAGPVGAWAGDSGIMFVDNEQGRSLTAIDAQTLDVVRTYSLGFTPAMAATGPNDELWVTDTDNGKVIITMTTADNRIGEVSSGAGAHAIAFADDGSTAYVTNQSAGTLSAIDVNTKTVRTTVQVGAKPNGLVFRRN